MSEVRLSVPRSRVRLAILSFYFTQGLCFASWASRIPTLKSTLNVNDGDWGSILLAIPLGQLLAMPFAGQIVSRFGSVNVMLTAMCFYVLALLGIGYSPSIMFLIVSLVLFGVFGNFLNISVNTQGVFIENYYARPIMAFFHGGWSIAGFFGALLGLLAINLDLTPFFHFVGVAIVVLLISLLNYKYLFPDPEKVVKADKPIKGKRQKLPKIEKVLVLLGIVGFCGMASEGAMFDWSGVYFQDVVEAPHRLVLLGYASFMIMMASGRFIADKLIAKFGHMRVLQTCGVLISSGLFIAVLFPNIIVCTIAFMIIGLGTSSVVPIVYSVSGRATSIAPNMALVIVSSFSFIGFLMGPPLIGHIAHIANLRYSYALIGLFGICITILVSNMRVFKKKD